MRRSMWDHGEARLARTSGIVSLALVAGIVLGCPRSGRAQDTWSGAVNDQWNNAGNWSSGIPNGSGTSVLISNTASNPVVISGIDPTIANLTLSSASNGLTISNDDSLTMNGTGGSTISNAGAIAIDATNNSTVLNLNVNTNLTSSGAGGTVTLSSINGQTAFIQQSSAGVTLTNVNNTIQGNGVIGNSGLTLNNESGGTINANVNGGTLTLNGSGGITNTGLLEATNGGTLAINGNFVVNNAGGMIESSQITSPSVITSSVNLSGGVTIQGGTLNSNGGFLGTTNSSTATLDGSNMTAGAVTIQGTYTATNNTFTYLLGTITNQGNIQVNAINNTTVLYTNSANVTLSGGGIVTLGSSNGQTAEIVQNQASETLTNANNTIQGNGTIGNSGLTLVNQSGGTINANVNGGTLTLNGGGGITNAGLLEATNGGTLAISGNFVVNNAGGMIESSQITSPSVITSSVNLSGNVTIQGGTLNSNGGFLGTTNNSFAALDGSTSAGAVTIQGTYTATNNTDTYLLGTITNQGNIQVNATNNTTELLTNSSNVMLNGGGTVTLASTNGQTAEIMQNQSSETLTNVNNTIQGNGVIGNGGLTLVNEATVNANVNDGTLTLNGSGGITNTGLLEATNGGTLALSGNTINNNGGTIQSSTNSAVDLFNHVVVQGGLLNSNGGFLGTTNNSYATLDGSTTAGAVTIQGTYTATNNTDTYLLGTITNQGNIQVNATNNGTELLTNSTNVMLNGGGTVTLASSNGQTAYIQQNQASETLTNVNNTIQGNGTIGNGGLTLVNEAEVNANVNGGTLTLNGSGGVTNTGTLEATNGGTLALAGITVNNNGGTIQSSTNSSVDLFNQTVVQGGVLNSNGGFLGTTNNSYATLDGSTTAGAVTIQGTYTATNDTYTYLLGSITNQGNIQVDATNNGTVLWTNSPNVTLNGGGTVTLSSINGQTAYIQQGQASETLTNVNNTIQGNGIVGNGGLTLVNESGGTILANVSGQTLLLNGSGGVTNSGTLQANSGSTLFVDTTLSNYNASTSTLTGGTYNAESGTIEFSQANGGSGTKAVIAINAATILLDGSSAKIADGSGNDILRGFISNNTAAGSLTIQNGANLTTASSGFTNAGSVTVGANSTFTVGGSNNYVQSSGLTSLTSTTSNLIASNVEIIGGTLQGIGTIHGNLSVSGATIAPGLPGTPGTLTITGSFTDPMSTLDIHLFTSSDYDSLSIGGTATLSETELDLAVAPGFSGQVGDLFTILTSGELTGTLTNLPTDGSTIMVGGDTFSVEYTGTSIILDLKSTSVPEPGSVVMLCFGIGGVGAVAAVRRRRSAQS